MIRLLIADDHPLVLNGIRQGIQGEHGMKVVGQATSSTALMRALETTECDVIVTDYSMPGELGDGLLMLQLLRRRYPRSRIVVVTMLDNPALIASMQKAGVGVIFSKADGPELLPEAIRAAHSGRDYLSPLIHQLLKDYRATAASETRPRLSKRELEVLRQYAGGASISEIARIHNRSTKTISAQKSVAMRKLGLANDYELFQYASTHGLVADVK
ncbi:response regulator [Pseudomonas nicosulfuronedens]